MRTKKLVTALLTAFLLILSACSPERVTTKLNYITLSANLALDALLVAGKVSPEDFVKASKFLSAASRGVIQSADILALQKSNAEKSLEIATVWADITVPLLSPGSKGTAILELVKTAIADFLKLIVRAAPPAGSRESVPQKAPILVLGKPDYNKLGKIRADAVLLENRINNR